MSNRRRENLFCVAVGLLGVGVGVCVVIVRISGVGISGVVVAGVGGPVVAGVGISVVRTVVRTVVSAWGRRRGSQAPAGLRTVLRPTPRTLRWVRGLLPGDEGAAWLVEVGSCLAEAQDKGERRRYVRSYRRNVPRLVWTSWTEHLSESRSRELS